MCDRGKETITEQARGGAGGGGRRVRRGLESRREGRGRSGAVWEGTGLPSRQMCFLPSFCFSRAVCACVYMCVSQIPRRLCI